jgi:hypothetical protein
MNPRTLDRVYRIENVAFVNFSEPPAPPRETDDGRPALLALHQDDSAETPDYGPARRLPAVC